MSLYRTCIRPILFRFDAEQVHDATIRAGGLLGRIPGTRRLWPHPAPCLSTSVGNLRFASPVGLGAGFDKNGRAAPLLSSLGFGFIEIGSVSADPSSGHPGRPRLWRVPADEGLMVNYGVPSDGADVVARRLASRTGRGSGRPTDPPVPLGVSLVETNRGGPASQAAIDAVIEELAVAARRFVGVADYLALNLHCPNSGTPGRGPFDDPEPLGLLLERLAAIAALPPVFIKITPPADAATVDRILTVVDPFPAVAGFILNTHAIRPYAYLRTPPTELARMRGSLIGRWLREPVEAALADWYGRIDRARHVLVAVGGIGTADDAYRAIRLGASLVQLVTALVYQGPGLASAINTGLARMLARDGLSNIREAVGLDHPRKSRF